MTWIKLADRKPRSGQKCLVYFAGEYDVAEYDVPDFGDPRFYTCDGPNDNVTHWQPLPAPPKEGE